MSGRRKIDTAVEAAVAREYAVGVSAAVLGKRHGINRKTVTTIVRRNGGTVLDQRSASGRPMMDTSAFAPKALELHRAGATNQAIGAALGICTDVVRRVLRGVGIWRANPAVRGERHGSWKGGVVKSGNGKYLAERVQSFPWPEMVPRAGYLLQHRKVMALTLGRPLDQHETVHHINGDGHDNRPENLQLHSGKHGKGVCHRCRHCGSTDIETTET